MASIFSKNGILSGRIDHYCLICAEQFTNEEEALAHVVDSQHKENLETCGYFENYKEDFIRKVKGIYYCEPCSLTFPTATKVALHIDEPTHIKEKKKISPWLTRVENDIIAFNQFIISDDAWNGCVEDTCVLCNSEFDDSGSHKVIRSHVLKLIKSEVICDNVENTVYRTIDARTKQCLTCNVIIGNEPTSHFKTVDHKEAYKLYDPTVQNNETENTVPTTNNGKETQNVKVQIEKAHVNDSIQVDIGNMNENIKKEACVDANEEINKDTNKNANTAKVKNAIKEATKPVDEVKVKPKQSAEKKNAEELDKIFCKNLGAKNYVTRSTGDRWCVLCEWLLEDSPEDHIRSKHHQNLLKLHKERLAENNNNIQNKGEESNLYESVDRYQKSKINIDLINETAFCKKCSKTIDFNTDAIEKHIEEHKKTSNKKSPETLPSGITSNGTERTTLYTKPVLIGKDKRPLKTVSVGEYAEQHGFTYNRADYSYYCRPCCRRLSTTLDDLQKHVASRIHTENTKQTSQSDAPEAPVKEPLCGYIKIFELLGSMNDGILIIINDKYWLNAFGFLLIARKNDRIFCHGCHIDLTLENVMDHIMTDNHSGILEKCLLITSLENEFIREIKLDVYHCGYCNITENDWDDILDHIGTAEHKRVKSSSEQKLRDHKPNFLFRFDQTRINDIIKQFVQRQRF